jgi:acylphosphatase
MVQYEIKISGRVQGVNFRSFALRKAREIGIKGWVKNETDGSVLVRASGEETDMNTFLDYLRSGPSMARVDNITKHQINSKSEFSGFTVKY